MHHIPDSYLNNQLADYLNQDDGEEKTDEQFRQELADWHKEQLRRIRLKSLLNNQQNEDQSANS